MPIKRLLNTKTVATKKAEAEVVDYRTPRPTTQQQSSLVKEREQEVSLIHEALEFVKNYYNSRARIEGEISRKANKKFQQVLQINSISEDGKLSPAKVGDKYLEFHTDDEYNAWWDKGGADRDLNVDGEYTVVRVIVPK